MEEEEWRAVVGHEGSYEVSSLGRVRSLDRVVVSKRGVPRRLTGKVLSSGSGNGWYVSVGLYGPSTHRRVHQLVAAAFIGPQAKGVDVRHLDGDRENNKASNLAYGTRAQNMADALTHGTTHLAGTPGALAYGQPGEVNAGAKLDPGKVREIRRLRADGISLKAIGQTFDVSMSSVSMIALGKSWTHVV